MLQRIERLVKSNPPGAEASWQGVPQKNMPPTSHPLVNTEALFRSAPQTGQFHESILQQARAVASSTAAAPAAHSAAMLPLDSLSIGFGMGQRVENMVLD